MISLYLVKALLIIGPFMVLLGMMDGIASAQKKPHPIAVMVKEQLKDPGKPFTLVVRFQAKPGAGEKLEAAFEKAAKLTRQEKGNLAYQLNRDVKTPENYILYERWQDLPSLEAHLSSAHIATLLTELTEVRAAPPEAQVLLPVGE